MNDKLFFLPCDAFKRTKKYTISPKGSSSLPVPPPSPLLNHQHTALGKDPQFTTIRYTQNSNLHNLIQFNSYFIQLLLNTHPTHTIPHALLHPFHGFLPVTAALDSCFCKCFGN